MNEDWIKDLNTLLGDYAEANQACDALKLYHARGAILDHINTMEPNRVPRQVSTAYAAWIRATTGQEINALSPELKSLTNLVGVFSEREDVK